MEGVVYEVLTQIAAKNIPYSGAKTDEEVTFNTRVIFMLTRTYELIQDGSLKYKMTKNRISAMKKYAQNWKWPAKGDKIFCSNDEMIQKINPTAQVGRR